MSENGIRKLALTVAFLSEREQKEFFKNYLASVSKRQVNKIFPLLATVVCDTSEIEKWIQTRLKNDMTLTPRRVAYECRVYKRIDRRLNPYLLNLARRIKRRLLMRQKRSES